MDKASHILQFEYFDAPGFKVFLKVHATFKHHYTGETMRYVQFDYLDRGDTAVTAFGIVNEAEFQAFYNARVDEEIEEYVTKVAEGISNGILDGLLG